MEILSLVVKDIHLLISQILLKVVQKLLPNRKEFDTLFTAIFRVNRIKSIEMLGSN